MNFKIFRLSCTQYGSCKHCVQEENSFILHLNRFAKTQILYTGKYSLHFLFTRFALVFSGRIQDGAKITMYTVSISNSVSISCLNLFHVVSIVKYSQNTSFWIYFTGAYLLLTID